MKPEVLIYTTSWCPFCRRAKALLQEKGVAFTELDIEADPAHRKAMIESSGRSTVPQIFINETHGRRIMASTGTTSRRASRPRTGLWNPSTGGCATNCSMKACSLA